MDIFDKISISQFIWYLVPGLSLIFLIALPVSAVNAIMIKSVFETLGPIGIFILSINLGFIVEGLRLYRLRPNYFQIRKDFFSELQGVFHTDLDPYFVQSNVSDLARKKNAGGISLHHSIWIMLGQISILTFIEAIYWLVFPMFFNWCNQNSTIELFGAQYPNWKAALLCLIFFVIFLIISIRLIVISTEDQRNTNKMFLNFASQNKDQLKTQMNLTS